MSKKATSLPLPKADKYDWIGPFHWNKFLKGNITVNLMTITNDRIEQLLKEEPKYWSQKFKAVAPVTSTKADKGDS